MLSGFRERCYIWHMAELPKRLEQKLSERKAQNALRSLPTSHNLIDFSSNDYLGLARNEAIYANTFQSLLKRGISQNGATGSRLLSGNHELYKELEEQLTKIHEVESALIFNSGYDANIGIFSSIPQRNDVVFYDELIHASIRDGIKMGNAKSYKFKHNDIADLKVKCQAELGRSLQDIDTYIVTESVFSMDGDSPDLKALAELCKKNNYHLIVDEAHAVGIFGNNGTGLVQQLQLKDAVFARIVTFGKALGCHGAAVLGNAKLKEYLVNFARSFIYTTGLPPHTLATALCAYQYLGTKEGAEQRRLLLENISRFNLKLETLNLKQFFIPSSSAIQCCLIRGNERVKSISKKFIDEGFDIKPILSPTVPEGQERLRFCIHGFNTQEEIAWALQLLKKYL